MKTYKRKVDYVEEIDANGKKTKKMVFEDMGRFSKEVEQDK